MKFPQALLTPTYVILALLFVTFWALVLLKRLPDLESWRKFLETFEMKGAQLVLLWITDMIFIGVLVHYWSDWSATLQTTFVGLLSGVNGAFLGAIGAQQKAGVPITPTGPVDTRLTMTQQSREAAPATAPATQRAGQPMWVTSPPPTKP